MDQVIDVVGAPLKIDRRAFIAKLGGSAAVLTMAPELLAEELEDEMLRELDKPIQQKTPMQEESEERTNRRGTGRIFTDTKELAPMPDKPTFMDFYKARFSPGRHGLQSATNALETGQPERTIFACLVHDTVQNLVRSDHGYWGAQLFGPYVDERISWGIRYHQALRFFPDDEVGYAYPEMYNRIFGKDYQVEDYIQRDYEMVRKHKWYMESRLITVNDQYGFVPGYEPSLDPFTDIIGRQFKQPKEGLGQDNSPSAHMWRTLQNPERPL
ncbi:uncharacterized protein METZ01_LOCUS212956 [marine metagenome]|uniref:HD domain-containing protein n=1 Tax=marine metagenome TaxID=408172 RepID=A0A382FBT2_9ZZZZ